MLKKIICFLGIIGITFITGCTKVEKTVYQEDEYLTGVTTQYLTNPLAIDETPFFSWKMYSDEVGATQKAYQIYLATDIDALERGDYIWDSGVVESDMSVAIPYTGEPLLPETHYNIKIKVWNQEGEILTNKEPAFFETGLLTNDWSKAEWIGVSEKESDKKDWEKLYNYSISFDFLINNAMSGCIFGAEKGRYGDYFLCSINTMSDVTKLVLEKKFFRKSIWIDTIDIPNIIGSEKHNMTIKQDDSYIYIFIDKDEVYHKTIGEKSPLGDIGFFSQRGRNIGYYDNLLVCDDEKTYINEDFERETDLFTPYYTRIEDGCLKVPSGWLITSGAEQPAPMFRKQFELQKPIKDARLYVSSFGIYDMSINAQPITETFLNPGQSVYDDEVFYRCYDVTDWLQQGPNVIGGILGHGKYNRSRYYFGDALLLKAKLVCTFKDGTQEIIVTDETWKGYNNGPIRNDDFFSGEYYDVNCEQPGYDTIVFDDSKWEKVYCYRGEKSSIPMKANLALPVSQYQELHPQSVSEPIDGVYVYDMGHNFSGTCSYQFEGKAGQQICFRYAEMINDEKMRNPDGPVGTIWTDNLFTADNTDYYICAKDGPQTYIPKLVWRGYRYIEITGLERPIDIKDIHGIAIASSTNRAGHFECSNQDINNIYEAIYRTQQSNFVDVPSDCPQRDERLCWTGDLQVFSGTAIYNSNIYGTLNQVLDAMRYTQDENGAYSDVAYTKSLGVGVLGWSDAGIILTWQLYIKYGNTDIIRENFDAMCLYADYLINNHNESGLIELEGYGDHLTISDTDRLVSNTAQCVYTLNLLQKMCHIIGEYNKEQRYFEECNKFKKAFQVAFINDDGAIKSWSLSDFVIALGYQLYPNDIAQLGAEKCNIVVDAYQYHPYTGFISTNLLLPVLSEYGYTESAYKLLEQTDYPSWTYMIEKGAKTISECWYDIEQHEDGSYTGKGSFNHYALGSIGEWMYTDILGIKVDENEPAYKHFYLSPKPGGTLNYAKGSYESMYGMIESEWHVSGNEITYRFRIPANTSATLTLPGDEYQNLELVAGEYSFTTER